MSKVDTAKNKVYPIKNKKVRDMTADDLKFHLVKCLDERKSDLLNVDMVLIENQPTFKNPTMKAISDTLYTWFMIRGIVDKDINQSTIQKIKFISPSNKLKQFDQKTIENADESQKYKETKKLSIENTKTILLSYKLNQWIDVIMSHQKKDDLADSFLQGWYILNNMNEDKLYNEWKKLYDLIVIKVADLVEENKENKLNKLNKKKVLKLDLSKIDQPVNQQKQNQILEIDLSSKIDEPLDESIEIIKLSKTAKSKTDKTDKTAKSKTDKTAKSKTDKTAKSIIL
jgi:hypothetical protein